MIFVVSSEYIPDVEVESDYFQMNGRDAAFFMKLDNDFYPKPVAFIAGTYRIRVKEETK